MFKKNRNRKKKNRSSNYSSKRRKNTTKKIPSIINGVVMAIAVVLISTVIVNFFEYNVTIKYEGIDRIDGRYIFKISNKSKFDVIIESTTIEIVNESYVSDKTIGELGPEANLRCVSIDGRTYTKFNFSIDMFLPDRNIYGGKGVIIENLSGIKIKSMDEKRTIIETSNRGDVNLFIADLIIYCRSIPTNSFYKLMQYIAHQFGSTIGNSYSVFRIENDHLFDLHRPEYPEQFNQMIIDNFRSHVKK